MFTLSCKSVRIRPNFLEAPGNWCRAAGIAIATGVLVFGLSGALAPPSLADHCTDGDGDTFSPEGDHCGLVDCNDGDPNVSPDAAELCDDAIDNNCDGAFDEDMVGELCVAFTDGLCLTASNYVCGADSMLDCPIPDSGVVISELEDIAGNPDACFDGRDNDCDDLTDVQEPACQTAEFCDGLDNDGDLEIDENFPDVGDACAAGFGACETNSSIICTADAGGTFCPAVASPPGQETIAVGGSCFDGIDNDCDDLTDDQDPDCVQLGELCNGADDDGNGLIDEIFPELGLDCSNGLLGACAAFGTNECNLAMDGTQCSADLVLPGDESDLAACTDGIDNDCDGFADSMDPDCENVIALDVSCALPYARAKPGGDCTGTHRIMFSPDTEGVSADLLSHASDGGLLGFVEDVAVGDFAHLASRTDPGDLKLKTRSRKKKPDVHTVFSPVPLMSVTAGSGPDAGMAFCSILPYLEVIEPDGQVISLSEGDSVDVKVAIPLVDVDTLEVLINGVDLFAALGIDPTDPFNGFPGIFCENAGDCFFDLSNNGDPVLVEVRDLVVDGLDGEDSDSVVGAIGLPQTNVMSMTLIGMPCGGHIVHVEGDSLGLSPDLDPECNIDDLVDAGTFSVFGVIIDEPLEQAVVGVPTTVAGQVCGGVEIASLSINGLPLEVSGQTMTIGDGMTSADEYNLDFEEEIGQTDLTEAVQGTAPLGTFHPGSNRLVADASDVQGNRTFATRIFATGQVQAPDSAASARLERLARGTENEIISLVNELNAEMAAEIDNAFVLGITPTAAQDYFNERCADTISQFTARVEENLEFASFGEVESKPACSCNVDADIVVQSVSFIPSTEVPLCPATFLNDKIRVTVHLPDLLIQSRAEDSCKIKDPVFGACIAETVLDIEATTTIEGISYVFDITEDGIETQAPPDPSTQVMMQDNIDVQITNDSDINCIGGDICEVVVGGLGQLVTIFSFGLVNGGDLIPLIEVDVSTDVADAIGASEPDPMEIDEIEYDEDQVGIIGLAAFVASLEDVEIDADGLIGSLSANFSSQVSDPEVADSPGALLTPAPRPTIPQLVSVGGQEISLLIADDTLNQVFASMVRGGALKSLCLNTGKTADDFLPADCEDLGDPNTEAGANIQGICHATKGADCETLVGATTELEAVEQGVCHGVLGDDCATIPTSGDATGETERSECGAAPELNLDAGDPVLLCARQDLPPQILFVEDSGSDGSVDSDLLYNDLSVFVVADRGGNGFAGGLDGLPGCYGQDAALAPECLLYTLCLDMTLVTEMSLASVCEGGETGFQFLVTDVMTSSLEDGVVCGAAVETDDALLVGTAAADATVAEVAENAELFAPPFCAEGLNLGGRIDFNSASAKLFSVRTDSTDFADYLGVTGVVLAP